MRYIRKIISPRFRKNEDLFVSLHKILGFKPKNISFYKQAFTHRSMNYKDHLGYAVNYERLEFLGDAVLGMIVASYLYNEVPGGDEGYLTQMRSKLVSRKYLNELGKDLRLIELMKCKIPLTQFGVNVHGNLLEALIGAIFLDRNYTYCEKFIRKSILPSRINIEALESTVVSYKSLVIEWCQKNKYAFKYDTFEALESGDIRYFQSKLFIKDKLLGQAKSTSKKKAEESVSKQFFLDLKSKMKDFSL